MSESVEREEGGVASKSSHSDSDQHERDHQKMGLDGQSDQEHQTDLDSLEREKKLRMDLEEDLKRSQESIIDLQRDNRKLEEEINKNTEEITFLLNKIEDAQSSVHLQKTIKEQQARIKDVQEEMEAEHAARSNVEKQRDDLHLDLERAERDNRKLEDDLKRSQKSIIDLEEDLKRSQKSIMDLQRDKQQSDHKITEQQAGIKDVQEEMEAEHAAHSNVEKQRDYLHLDLERAERDNRKLEEDLKRSQKSIVYLEEDLKRSQESIMDLQRDKQQSDHKITEKQARINELEEEPAKPDQEITYSTTPSLTVIISVLAVYTLAIFLAQTYSQEKKRCDAELRRIQKYAVDVTVDPDTAHPALILSDDGKQVSLGNIWKNLPDNNERFSKCVNVLGKQGFSSGRFYFEVQVKSKTGWDLGVVRESINRKGYVTLNPNNGYWAIVLRNGNEYWACADPAVLLPVREELQKVGVFVDYEEGLVSFYDVEVEARVHLYSFTGCSFTEKLYPYFSPCLNDGDTNSAPLIIL